MQRRGLRSISFANEGERRRASQERTEAEGEKPLPKPLFVPLPRPCARRRPPKPVRNVDVSDSGSPAVMARWTKNHMLELGAVLLLVGLIGTIIAFTDNYADSTPSWLQWYENLVTRPQGDFNLILLILAPILLIWGGFWVGEQLVLRRRFERLLDTPKKSEFVSRRQQMEEVTKRLPDGYRKRITEKESEFASKRSA